MILYNILGNFYRLKSNTVKDITIKGKEIICKEYLTNEEIKFIKKELKL